MATKTAVVRFSNMNERGEFNCPFCGQKISPDDDTDKTYQIVKEIRSASSHFFSELILKCCKCSGKIRAKVG